MDFSSLSIADKGSSLRLQVFPTSTRRAAAGFYHSPYAPK